MAGANINHRMIVIGHVVKTGILSGEFGFLLANVIIRGWKRCMRTPAAVYRAFSGLCWYSHGAK